MTSDDTEGRDEARAAWNGGAAAWDIFVETGADYYRHEVHGPAPLSACGDVAGKRVLDLGCGQGFFSRQLAERGAVVTGVDLAEEQIAAARRHEAAWPLGIDYRLMDAAEVAAHLPPASFDLVTACMSLHDMPNAAEVLRAGRTVLPPGGRVVCSLPHPCTDTPYREWERDDAGHKLALKIDRYFESGRRTVRWNMPRLVAHWQTPYWYRTLTEWSDLIARAGLAIARLHEPRPTPAQVEAKPDLEDCYRLPYFLVLELISTNNLAGAGNDPSVRDDSRS